MAILYHIDFILSSILDKIVKNIFLEMILHFIKNMVRYKYSKRF